MRKFNLPHMLIYLHTENAYCAEVLIVWRQTSRQVYRQQLYLYWKRQFIWGKLNRQALGFANSSEAIAFIKHKISFCLVAFLQPNIFLLI